MDTYQVKFKTMQPNWKEPMEDALDIEVGKDAKTEIERVLKEYNDEEERRDLTIPEYKAVFRKLVSIDGETGIKKTFCEFIKYNNFTIMKNGDSYDIMYCKNCHEFVKRHGVGMNFDYNRICDPSTLCIKCNKRFKTEKGLQRHMEKGKHKAPEWLPDGV